VFFRLECSVRPKAASQPAATSRPSHSTGIGGIEMKTSVRAASLRPLEPPEA